MLGHHFPLLYQLLSLVLRPIHSDDVAHFHTVFPLAVQLRVNSVTARFDLVFKLIMHVENGTNRLARLIVQLNLGNWELNVVDFFFPSACTPV